MRNKRKYVAINMRPECHEEDCYSCHYFDHKGHCSADKEIKDCDYCKTAFSDRRLDADNDLSYMGIGKGCDGFHAYIRASAAYNPPVAIVVDMRRDDLNRNVDVYRYAPAYCPMCGRKIIENETYLKNKETGNGR